MNIQQIIEVLNDVQRNIDDGALVTASTYLTSAKRNLRTLQQLEGMTATQQQSDWVMMPKHLTDDMVRAGSQVLIGDTGLGDALSEALGPELETLYQSLIEARPQ